MVDSDVKKKYTTKDLLHHTRYKKFEGTSLQFVIVCCDVAKVFEETGLEKESVTLSVEKHKFLADQRSVLADVVSKGTRLLFDKIRKKYPELVQ